MNKEQLLIASQECKNWRHETGL